MSETFLLRSRGILEHPCSLTLGLPGLAIFNFSLTRIINPKGFSIASRTIHELYYSHKRKEPSPVTGNNIIVFLALIAMMIIAFAANIYVRTFLTRRAIYKVIEIFYQHNALGINSAKTLHELGLERPDVFQRLMKPRDYKQNALQILIRRGLICEEAGGRLYLVEEKLDQGLRNKRNEMLLRRR